MRNIININQNNQSILKVEELLNAFLLQLGILPNLKGYHYIKESVKFCIFEENNLSRNNLKKAYCYLAKQSNEPTINIERNIRHAISVSFNSGKIKNINNIMRVKVLNDFVKPSNNELLSLLIEKIKQNYFLL